MAEITLITTTINNPTVLRQYRASDRYVFMIIAGDLKTPHEEARALCKELGNAMYLDPQAQESLRYGCSEILGWNSIQRRNIALLEAIKSGADIILSVDDDNAPRSKTYFEDLRKSFKGYAGLTVSDADTWFNPGSFAKPPFYYRGFPFTLRAKRAQACRGWHGTGILSKYRAGIVNGLIYGDPDINAIDRYPHEPYVKQYQHSIRNLGLYVNPRQAWTPINSQNTAYVRDLAPLAFVLPGIGRYDDIWASYIAQRVIEATDYCVYFGEPSVTQERNPHDWLKDLENEIYGMRHTEAFCEDLKRVPMNEAASVLENLEALRLEAAWLLPQQTRDFLAAWMDDAARVL